MDSVDSRILVVKSRLAELQEELSFLEGLKKGKATVTVEEVPAVQREQDDRKTYLYVVKNGPERGIYDNWMKIPKHRQKEATQCQSQLEAKIILNQESKETMMGMFRPQRAPKPIQSVFLERTREEFTIDEWLELYNFARSPEGPGFEPVIIDDWITKVVILPGADPEKAKRLLDAGLVKTIYPGPFLSELEMFNAQFNTSIRNYAKAKKITPETGIHLNVISTIPDWENGYSSAYHYIQVGPNSGKFRAPETQPRGPHRLTTEEIVDIRADSIQSMFEKLEEIREDSKVKLNYNDGVGGNYLMISKFSKVIAKNEYGRIAVWRERFKIGKIKVGKSTIRKLAQPLPIDKSTEPTENVTDTEISKMEEM